MPSDREAVVLSMQKEVIGWCHEKGWEPDPKRTFGDECALLHTEISEAVEAYRSWGFSRFSRPTILPVGTSVADSGPYPIGEKPEGVPSEFADLLIRLLHYCEFHGINLYQEYQAKMAYNRTRANRHGGKRL